ncbi:23S rRNA (guanosine-2'-O-)-methyltransferase RlmB [mine drainage metagenome]|uniref:23S rRNA (Guanosine-2'-O-)-methyltransferase RlmB n=1 Tax=mine drainage metagenome TaxID=410659 RepID=A0A1J5SQ78_9ZZZZ
MMRAEAFLSLMRQCYRMRGYFGIGVEGVSKQANVGSLFRSAHAFGASFVFTIAADYTKSGGKTADTSDAVDQVPFYAFPDLAALALPSGCRLVGVELVEDAVDLPSFHHPAQAAYVLGRERGSLTPALLARCDHVIKIPTRFCVNLGIAGAIVMYDRVTSLGRFAPRPVRAGGPTEARAEHVHGRPLFRSSERMALHQAQPPARGPADQDEPA